MNFSSTLEEEGNFKVCKYLGKLFHNLGTVALKSRYLTDLRAREWYKLQKNEAN